MRNRTQHPCRIKPDAFSLVEVLAAVAIISVMAAFLFPAMKRARIMAAQSVDLSRLRQYSAAANLMMAETNPIQIQMLYDPSNILYNYTGDSLVSGTLPANAACYSLMASDYWNSLNQAMARSKGATLTKQTRAYTVNQGLFPARTPTTGNPNPSADQKDPLNVVILNQSGFRPLLFTGTLNQKASYASGQKDHANPIYSSTNKTSPNYALLGKTAILFVDGHAAIVDLSKENQTGWW